MRAASPHLLLVEDNHLLALASEDLLVKAGYDVTLAATCREATAALEGELTFEALVTDIRLPDGSGWDLAHAARQRAPEMVVVYCTGDSAEDWMANGVPKSVLLQKPFAEAQLVAAVTTLLNERTSST